MKRLLGTFLALSMLIAISAPAFITTAQNPTIARQSDLTGDPFQPGQANRQHKLPANARIGSTPERKAALNNLTPEEREKVRQMVDGFVSKAAQNKELKQQYKDNEPTSLSIAFKDKLGNRQLRTAQKQNTAEQRLTSSLRIKGTNRYATLETTQAQSDAIFAEADIGKSISGQSRAHASRSNIGRSSAAQASCDKTVGKFVTDFYQGGLVRLPTLSELQQWTDALALAQQQGATQTLTVAQSLGYTVFQSQEYTNRGRTDSEYVYDLYKGWLQRGPDQGGWDFWLSQVVQNGRAAVLPAFPLSSEFSDHVALLCPEATFDGENDGLSDSFEGRVADAFTPYYHISGGESNQFVTFQDNTSVPETIKQYFGQTPVSHFRVHKEGFSTNASGALVSVLRIDYLTLLDGDGGLVGGAACAWNLVGMGWLVAESTGHFLDHERSAMLVAAPVNSYDYNLDPAAYSIYNIYTAGHEFTTFDTSMYANYFYNPVPAFNHIELALSKSKHATYAFNPDYFVLTPWYIIDATYQSIEEAYYWGYMPWWAYLAALAAADDVFFYCLVERFNEQGGRYAELRINVGEVGSPINQSSFIAVPDINSKFTTPYYRW